MTPHGRARNDGALVRRVFCRVRSGIYFRFSAAPSNVVTCAAIRPPRVT